MLIVEAKAPDVAIEAGMREAHLYAGEINKRYPPNVNPISFILVSNGSQIALSEWDSDTDAFIVKAEEAAPGTSVLNAMQDAIGKVALENRAKILAAHFQARRFHSVASLMGGRAALNRQLGVNEFAQPLFPTLTKYFAGTEDETPDEVIDRAYVASNELGTYEGILETYLKDRITNLAGNQVEPIVTSRNTASGISTEVQKFSSNPKFYSRVQLIIGAVGAGKSTFIRRYYRRLISKEARERTRWAFLNFNFMHPAGEGLRNWISERFITSFSEVNKIDCYDLKNIERIFEVELNRFENGPAKLLKKDDHTEFTRQRVALMQSLSKDSAKFAECIARYFSGEKGLGIVIVFDNVDKRSRDQQLEIFEAAQWFKNMTRALVLVNLRDSTFEAHRDEPPLDAFINAINFYIQPPRFAQVIRKRLELVLEGLPTEVASQQQYSLASGYVIKYPASRLGEFLLSIYLSIFDQRTGQMTAALEGLVAKDVRRALGMFSDIIVSPHVPTNQITGAALAGGEYRIPDNLIIRALMRGRSKYFSGQSIYIRNILNADSEHSRPSNLLNADILEYLIKNRKARIDFAQEGYATISTIVKKMGQLGYDEGDVFKAVGTLVGWGLVEPESLVIESLGQDDPVRVHASGFIHTRVLLTRSEYLVGITPDMNFASREAAEEIGSIWSGHENAAADLTRASRLSVLHKLRDYFVFEYNRRCKRHPFYQDAGYGGRLLVNVFESEVARAVGDSRRGQGPMKNYRGRRT